MKTFPAWLAALSLTLLPAFAGQEQKGDESLITKSERIVFLGDSITAACTYTSNFATWAEIRFPKHHVEWINAGLSSETVSGLSEKGHAGGRFPRPDLHERLGRVLEQTKPDLVFACYGMNCGIQMPLDEERFAKYREGIEWLKKEVEAAGAKIVFLTPPYYDEIRNPKKAYYTDVLAEYSKWLLGRRADGWNVIDVNGTMTSFIEEKRKTDPKFSLQPDAVHPNPAGHWLMAQGMIRWFGDEEAAKSESVKAMLEARGQPAGIAQLCHQRMTVLHDAWLTATKHKRPGVRPGKPLPEANKIAAELTQRIDSLKR
ncbi:lipolytic enzyme [Haloferula helveola]|uniref:Lipolytic enzyme n=1 Tax=Haloferula helveola TaxID=490095 RepID=A0ABM7RBS6_9BACT|nr:lipolytic enzyme [Haloferula helveola]